MTALIWLALGQEYVSLMACGAAPYRHANGQVEGFCSQLLMCSASCQFYNDFFFTVCYEEESHAGLSNSLVSQ